MGDNETSFVQAMRAYGVSGFTDTARLAGSVHGVVVQMSKEVASSIPSASSEAASRGSCT